jgi:hypothetical protein
VTARPMIQTAAVEDAPAGRPKPVARNEVRTGDLSKEIRLLQLQIQETAELDALLRQELQEALAGRPPATGPGDGSALRSSIVKLTQRTGERRAELFALASARLGHDLPALSEAEMGVRGNASRNTLDQALAPIHAERDRKGHALAARIAGKKANPAWLRHGLVRAADAIWWATFGSGMTAAGVEPGARGHPTRGANCAAGSDRRRCTRLLRARSRQAPGSPLQSVASLPGPSGGGAPCPRVSQPTRSTLP